MITTIMYLHTYDDAITNGEHKAAGQTAKLLPRSFMENMP